jgi:hypothetical protein
MFLNVYFYRNVFLTQNILRYFFIYYFNFWYYHDKIIKKYFKNINSIFFIQKQILNLYYYFYYKVIICSGQELCYFESLTRLLLDSFYTIMPLAGKCCHVMMLPGLNTVEYTPRPSSPSIHFLAIFQVQPLHLALLPTVIEPYFVVLESFILFYNSSHVLKKKS